MAELLVSTTTDFSNTVFAEPITHITFHYYADFEPTPAPVATFRSSQFDGNQVSTSLIVQMEAVHPDVDAFGSWPMFRILLDGAAGGNFDARGWDFSNLPDQMPAELTIIGTALDDIIYGSSMDDTIFLNGGADKVDAGTGSDFIGIQAAGNAGVIQGGSGHDFLQMEVQAETADLRIDLRDGGGGRDIGNGTTLDGFDRVSIITGSGDDTFIGTSDQDYFSGGAGNDRLDGRSGGFDYLLGGEGNDVMVVGAQGLYRGGDGDDKLVVDTRSRGSAFLFDLTAEYRADGLLVKSDFEILHFSGGSANDAIAAGGLADRLGGGGGGDVLSGRAGHDVLIGGTGADTMSGGLGADTFVFGGKGTALKRDQADVITDFEQGVDHIAIRSISGLMFIGTEAYGANDAEVGFRQTARNTIISVKVDANNNGINEIDYDIRLNGLFTLTIDDFVL